MDEDEELYAVWGDLLHEVPEAEDALREWKRKRALEAVRRAEAKRRRREYEEAVAWFVERRKQLREGGE